VRLLSRVTIDGVLIHRCCADIYVAGAEAGIHPDRLPELAGKEGETCEGLESKAGLEIEGVISPW